MWIGLTGNQLTNIKTNSVVTIFPTLTIEKLPKSSAEYFQVFTTLIYIVYDIACLRFTFTMFSYMNKE